jgi:hypothetical protein
MTENQTGSGPALHPYVQEYIAWINSGRQGPAPHIDSQEVRDYIAWLNSSSGAAQSAQTVQSGIRAHVASKTAVVFLVCALVIGALYSLCFTGVSIHPNLSLPVFLVCTLAVTIAALIQTGYAVHKRAFFLAIPILLLAAPSVIFGSTAFTFWNILFIHILYAMMIIFSVSGTPQNWGSIAFLGNLAKTIFPHPAAGAHILASISGNRPKQPVFSVDGSVLTSQKKRAWGIAGKIALGVLIAIPILAVILVCLANADPNFSAVMGNIGEWLNRLLSLRTITHILVTCIVAYYLLCYVQNAKHRIGESHAVPNRMHVDTVVSATVLILLNIVFAIFCFTQFYYLFRGISVEAVIDSYSSYARSGFFQLLFVTVINFTVVLLFMRWLNNMAHKALIKALLAILCVFTGVLIASSFYRLSLYIGDGGYTRLRLLVFLFLIMESLLILITIVRIFLPHGNLVKSYLATMFVFFLLANFIGSTQLVAKLNFDRAVRNNYNVRINSITETVTDEDFFLLKEFHDQLDPGNERQAQFKIEIEDSSVYQSWEYYYNPHKKADSIDHWQNFSVMDYLNAKARQAQKQ